MSNQNDETNDNTRGYLNQNRSSNNQRQRSNYYTNNTRSQQRVNNNNYRNNNIKQPDNDQSDYNRNNQRSYQRSRGPQQQQEMEFKPETIRHKQSRLISISSSTGTSINCICCLHELETYAYYLCQHYVCLKCAIKMRILCQKTDCPVCRQESKSILCTKKPIEEEKNIEDLIKNCPNYSRPIKLNPQPGIANAKPPEPEILPNAGINFESDSIKEEYNEILSSKCQECGDLFRDFDALDYHMRKAHRLFYCELCLENLKLFPYERKYYNREELATHKRNGDKSGEFKGHPICHYCDNRFYDRDELYRHYRKEHYFCHFCDSDGLEEYYKDYSELRSHFLESHYLCEMDRCSYNAAETHEYVVFRNELDLQAHKKQIHAKNKNDMKNYGKINIEFNVSRDRPSNNNAGSGRGKQQQQSYQRNNNKNNRLNNQNASSAYIQSSDDDEYSDNQISNKTSNTKPTQSAEMQRMDNDDFPLVSKTIRVDEEKRRAENIQEITNQEAVVPKPPIDLINEKQANDTAQPSQWRNLISQGNAPKINQEAEFPSLSSTVDSSAAFPTLAQLGFKSTLSNMTTQPLSKKQAKKEIKKNTSINKQPVASAPVINTKQPAKQPAQQPSVSNVKQPVAQQVPPPGFSQIIHPNKPVLTNNHAPPPGFEVVANKSIANSTTYIKPENYDYRNEALSSKLKNLFGVFDESEYQTFRNLSIEFRQNKLDANSYLAKCRLLLDGPLISENYINKENLETINSHINFVELIQEMIVLLPDAQKQEELYKSFYEYVESLKTKQPTEVQPQVTKKIWSKSVLQTKTETKRSFSSQLVKCQYCNQYLLENELSNHQTKSHNVKFLEPKNIINNKIEEEYPSLATTFVKAPVHANNKSTASTVVANLKEEFPSMASSIVKAAVKNVPAAKSVVVAELKEEFPPLSAGIIPSEETRYSSMPTTSLFANPSSHLSLVNRKKHRLQK